MQAVEAAMRAHLCGTCRDLALAWLPASPPRPEQAPHPPHAPATRAAPAASFKIAVRSADASVVAMLTRQQLEDCADGVVHPDVIALIRECLVSLRTR